MIHAISANQPSFRSVKLRPRLNVILAERAEGSSRKDTRNGLGKTTLIEIIHFCLGAKILKGHGLAIPVLTDWAFTIDMSLGGHRIEATRAVATPNFVTVTGLETDWSDIHDSNLMGYRRFTQEKWRSFLGRVLFSLPPKDAPRYNPSFRSLISYFVRRNHDSFSDPFLHSRHQQVWDMQLHIALLLGLEWHHAIELREIKDRQKDFNSLRHLVKKWAVPSIGGSIGELETERITIGQEIEDRSRALKSFNVHSEYESIQHEANQITEQLHEAANKRIIAARRLSVYNKAVEVEEPPSGNSIDNVYEEMGVVFSVDALRSLAEARDFYRLVVRDRRRFLQKEIVRLRDRISGMDAKIREWTESRARLLQILDTHGALEEMVELQERHAARCEALERVKTQIERRRKMESDERQIARDKTDLADLSARDYEERRDIWNTPVRLFNLNSQALYRAAGRLVIDPTDSGLKFNIEISKSGSDGINKMKIFCFDLAILESCDDRGLQIDFLVHDSEMFDGVDSRQRAAALERAHDVTRATGTQYICALNSDTVPYNDFRNEFEFEEHVRLKLIDGDPAGTLLGMVFDPPTKS